MNTPPNTENEARESYRDQLGRIARAMAIAQDNQVLGDVAEGYTPDQVALFVDGNLEKRFDKLTKQLEFVAGEFENFEDLVIEFIRTVPLAAYDSGQGDGQRLLDWILENKPVTAEQRDYITCQSARHEIEQVAREKRVAHIHFQEIRSLNERNLDRLETDGDLQIHLNPLRVWKRFHTRALLDEDAQTPADVIFFAVQSDISTAVLEDDGRRLIWELTEQAPITLDSWAATTDESDREELIELTRDLAAMGLVAVA